MRYFPLEQVCRFTDLCGARTLVSRKRVAEAQVTDLEGVPDGGCGF
jgi:hypothetical protein